MGLMERFADPELFDSLSFGEKMGGSAITMLMGMGITFIILCLLWGFVAIMGRAMGAVQKADKPSGKAKADAAPSGAAASAGTASAGAAPAEMAPAQASASGADDEVIAAVIAAAVAAYHGSGGTGNLVVKKITRISGDETPWLNTARKECFESRKL